jgi:cytochrome P450
MREDAAGQRGQGSAGMATREEHGRMTDALDPFFLADAGKLDHPYADLAWLRENRPVYHLEPLGQWFVFRYDDVRSLFADVRLSANRISGFLDEVPALVRDDVRRLPRFFASWLMMQDGDEHRRLRSGLHSGLNTSAIEALRGPIEPAADELLGRSRADQSLDISSDFGLLRPAYVLGDFIEVPVGDCHRVVRWSLDFVDFFNEIPITEETTRRMVSAAEDMMGWMRGLLAGRRRAPVTTSLG